MPTLPLSTFKETTEGTSPARAARMLLRLVRAAQPISRVDLARRLGLNRSTVTEIFKPLIASGIVLEEPLPSSTGRAQGRPPVGLAFQSKRDFFIGVNLGVRRSQVGIATLNGEILDEEEFDTSQDAQIALQAVRNSIEKLAARVPERELKAIGVSVPGPTDAERTKLLYAPHLGWRDVALADALRVRTRQHKQGVPVIVENDATAAAMYEARLRLRDATTDSAMNHFVLVRSGPGIRAGLVL